jgi:replicative DNA helicase
MADGGGRNPFDAPEPPRADEAEQAFLGALLVNNAVLDREHVAGLEPHHFAIPVHGRIFSAARAAIMRGGLADALTLREAFKDDPALVDHGGGGLYLARLTAASATIANANHYAVAIREAYIRREMLAVGEAITQLAMATDTNRTIEETLAEAVSAVAAVADSGAVGSKAVHISDAALVAVRQVEAAKKAGGKVTGISTGLIDLDRATSGLHAPDLIVLAGRPGMGKTALANSIALAAARDGVPVIFFSLEMSYSQLAQRILADMTGISTERQRAGHVSDDEMRELVFAQSDMGRMPLHIDDTPAASVTQLRMRVRSMARKARVGLVVVDYIQLLVASAKTENRVQELSKITRDLKVMAKELNIPVIALSQLSRSVESRDDKRPQLSDLRESGSIEQDADSVWMLYRHEYYLGMREPRRKDGEDDAKFNDRFEKWKVEMAACEGIADLAIEKNRHGARRTVPLLFDGPRTAFGNLARQ